jgi:hypothetical protein
MAWTVFGLTAAYILARFLMFELLDLRHVLKRFEAINAEYRPLLSKDTIATVVKRSDFHESKAIIRTKAYILFALALVLGLLLGLLTYRALSLSSHTSSAPTTSMTRP